MRTFAFELAYDGSRFHGMQVQPGDRTVQGALEAVLVKLLGHPVRIRFAGRTDAGVHATAQVVAFEVGTRIPLPALREVANAKLAPEMALGTGWEAVPGFEPRFAARRRRYRYVLEATGALPDPFRARLAAFPRIAELALPDPGPLVGDHDFWALAAKPETQERTLRTLESITVTARPPYLLVDLVAPGFLRGQVRNTVGAMLRIARGERPPGYLEELLTLGRAHRKDDTLVPAPAEGLYLTGVEYPEGLPGPNPEPGRARPVDLPWLW